VSGRIVKIALDSPLDTEFDYRWQPASEADPEPEVGQLALVPFGRREVIGIVTAVGDASDYDATKLRDVIALRTQLPPLPPRWLALCRFAADYYQRPLGEVMLPCLPKGLRTASTVALDRALKKRTAAVKPAKPTAAQRTADVNRVPIDADAEIDVDADAPVPCAAPVLNPGQQAAVDAITAAEGYAAHLLFGVTGSGKTEVYLHAAQAVIARAQARGEAAQVLIMIPEINLTPQLEASVRARFPQLQVVTLHSQLAEGERLRHWIAAHHGDAAIVLGTRLSVLAALPALKLIIADEEHDPSYKQQEGLRYSARDLAVWRARQLDIPVVLGSATPSIESWQHAANGRYRRLDLTQRAAAQAQLPRVGLIDMEINKAADGLSPPLVAALRSRLERGEQSLLFLNRRGYAPVMHCDACGWISNCRRCTAFMVLHKPERRLRCHHCSLELRIPQSCPTCGNVDLQPLGRGTQRVEEHLQQLFPDARVLRIDADSTRRKGSAQAAFDSVHRGEVDILLGTQMVAKGHDFQRLTLVGVINPDTALFSQDYRAGERLFAQLMQVAGRAGRAAIDVRSENHQGNDSSAAAETASSRTAQPAQAARAEVLVQTRYPQHPLYRALLAHDYAGFAQATLAERRSAGLPPFVFQALLRAEAKQLQVALDFLQYARDLMPSEGITINDPVPMTITRVAGVERAQLLVESPSRAHLQAFLKPWVAALREQKSRLRWSLEVDPVDI
jgi:primosomal protein N' (replication factor Y)